MIAVWQAREPISIGVERRHPFAKVIQLSDYQCVALENLFQYYGFKMKEQYEDGQG